MKTIKLMADYQCFPLWKASQGNVGNINPADLPISDQLRTDLFKWSEIFDSTLDIGDPASAGFKDDNAKDSFRCQGLALAERLRKELGPEFEIITKL